MTERGFSSSRRPGTIDTHAHVYPAAYLDQLEKTGVRPETTAITGGPRADSTDEDLSTHLRWMTVPRPRRRYSRSPRRSRPAVSPMIVDHHLEWVNGAPVEDAIAVLQLLKAGIPNRYPNLRFHIAHLVGDLPFLAQRIEDKYADRGAFPALPLQMLRRMWFDAASFHQPSRD